MNKNNGFSKSTSALPKAKRKPCITTDSNRTKKTWNPLQDERILSLVDHPSNPINHKHSFLGEKDRLGPILLLNQQDASKENGECSTDKHCHVENQQKDLPCTKLKSGKWELPSHRHLEECKHPRASQNRYEIDPTECLKTPENTNLFSYASNLLSRVTGRYLPSSVVNSGEKRRDEMGRLLKNDDITEVIRSIQQLSEQFKDVAQSVMSHRKELGSTLFKIENAYLKLFEKIMEVSLKMYWQYKTAKKSELDEKTSTIMSLKTQLQKFTDKIEDLSDKLAMNNIYCESQKRHIEELQKQVLCNEAHHDDTEIYEQQDKYRELIRYKLDMDRQLADIDAKEKQLQKQEHDLIIKQHRVEIEMKAEKKQAMAEARLDAANLKCEFFQSMNIRKKKKSVSSQTEADDDGLWDARDGMPLSVRKSTRNRLMWRRFNAYVTCKNCLGQPIPKEKLSNEEEGIWRAEVLPAETYEEFNQLHPGWTIPDEISSFLSNLPKTVVASRISTLNELVDRINLLYDQKFVADSSDLTDGIATQDLASFVTEEMLKISGNRRQSEVKLYQLIVSVKRFYETSSFVRLFARFLGCICNIKIPPKKKGKKCKRKENYSKSNASKEDMQKSGVSSCAYLDQSYLRVYLHARNVLLHSTSSLKRHHVICIDGATKWVPLDFSVKVLKHYLSFLNDQDLKKYISQLEYNIEIFTGDAIRETKDNHLAKRADLRKSILLKDYSKKTDCEDAHKEFTAIVPIDKTLELLIEILQLRSKYIGDELIDMFAKGDVNSDGDLSFTEFCDIVRDRAPNFTERRLLRMFREALTNGKDQSFSISMNTFIDVCTNHGLVALVESTAFEKLEEETSNELRRRSSVSVKTDTNLPRCKQKPIVEGNAFVISDPIPLGSTGESQLSPLINPIVTENIISKQSLAVNEVSDSQDEIPEVIASDSNFDANENEEEIAEVIEGYYCNNIHRVNI